jgi:hypothetical protein
MVHIDDLPFLGNAQVALGILSSFVICQPFYFFTDNTFFFFLLVSFGEFQKESYVGMWGHYGSRIVGVF